MWNRFALSFPSSRPAPQGGERIRQYAASISLICLVSAICFLFSAYIRADVTAFILLLVLSLIAITCDIRPVLLSALISALIWDYFFLSPRYNFRVGNVEDRILLSMYFVIALVGSGLTYKIRQMEKTARHKEEKANTLRLYNTLLNCLSHEFRTPLSTIIGATDNLMEPAGRLSGEDRQKLLAEISTASLRLNRQVENLLNMSRLESGYIRPRKDWYDIRELIGEVLKQLAEPLAAHRVETDITPELPLVKLDHGLVEQVLGNLVSNAAMYSPPASLIRVVAGYAGDRLVMSVEDEGPGFPEDEIGDVFDKFYRLKNSRIGGTGLGLSIVKGFVEAMEGEVHLTNRPAGGARFLISLPAEAFLCKLTGS
jgi:two-component system sensor histidine kinase KdpD